MVSVLPTYIRFSSSLICRRLVRSQNTAFVDFIRPSTTVVPGPPVEGGNEVDVQWRQGVAQIRIPLPSRHEACLFTVRPTKTVASLVADIQAEDRGVERVHLYSADGARLASSTIMTNLLNEPFRLRINDTVYDAAVPSREPSQSDIDEARNLVARLYSALEVDEFETSVSEECQRSIDEIRAQLDPLIQQKAELDRNSEIQTSRQLWLGLGLMGIQFGFLARLTWWEYSWDIMEPVTYFVTYATAIGTYAYFLLTRQGYEYTNAKERQYVKIFHKVARKKAFNIDEYNRLKMELAIREAMLDQSARRRTVAASTPASTGSQPFAS